MDSTAPTALYVHVPFCVSKCRYCDFYSLPGAEALMQPYVEAVARELALREIAPSTMKTIYLGGGTPTALPPGPMEGLLALLAPLLCVGGEFSVETNPCSITASRARLFAGAGVNRMTVGAQSFDDAELAMLGRAHQSVDIVRAVEQIRAAGCENIAMDLMYALPGQSEASWRRSLEMALSLDIAHLSAYALSYEQGTALEAERRAGRIHDMPDEQQRRLYDLAREILHQAGMEHYEISNFARPGRPCRQNLVYWHNQPYIGVGPGACSYEGGIRATHSPDLEGYIRRLRSGQMPEGQQERITGRLAMAETLMLGLRLRGGVRIEAFTRRHGLSPADAFPRSIPHHLTGGWLVRREGALCLTDEALFVSDEVLGDIVAEAMDHDTLRNSAEGSHWTGNAADA